MDGIGGGESEAASNAIPDPITVPSGHEGLLFPTNACSNSTTGDITVSAPENLLPFAIAPIDNRRNNDSS